MRPLIVDLGREYRGGQHQALLLLQGLLTRGHSPELITLRDSLLAQRAMDAGIHVREVSGRGRSAATIAIRQRVKARQVEIVHANEPHALSSAWAANAHRAIPVIASRRIALPLRSNYVSRARYRAASRIVAVSHFVEQSLLASGVPAERISMVHDGVPLPATRTDVDRASARTLFGIQEHATCLGNVAALVPEKGQELLIRAFAELRSHFPQSTLLLAGEGPDREQLEKLTKRLGVSDAVKFAGFVSDIGLVYAAIDIFVFPSHEEPLGSALLAAMACELPPVALACGGIPEVLENGKNGITIPQPDVSQLAAAIAQLLSDPSEARKLGKAARNTIVTRFSADRMVDQTLSVYEEVMSQQQKS